MFEINVHYTSMTIIESVMLEIIVFINVDSIQNS